MSAYAIRCEKCYHVDYSDRDAKRHYDQTHGPRHIISPVYMWSGYQWCNNCGVNIQRWGSGWRHRAGYKPPYED